MPVVLSDLGRYLFRLAPGNPILVRVVYAGGRRVRHLWLRAGYLLILAAIVVFGVVFAPGGTASLGDMAKHATRIFSVVSYAQLAMVCVLAPIFTAAAITQERDAQTFNILLSTPLTNGQIVLGSLLSRLYFVFVLLLAGIPLFCIMMVYGGVTGEKIANTTVLAASTAAVTGSLAIAISVVKIGTGRTIFSFYLAIAAYLIVGYIISSWAVLIPAEAEPAPGQVDRMSWLASIHPFLALRVVLGETPAPEFGAVARHGFPVSYLLAYPQYSYMAITSGASALLVAGSVFFVRRGVKQGEPMFLSRWFRGANGGGERTRKPRHVGANPVAWRETQTSASAAGGAAARYTIVVIGGLLALVLLGIYAANRITAAQARDWVFSLLAIEMALALFLATATAATSMTREKESNTLELLLTTPLTSSAIIWGKIRGLITLSLPLLILPVATILAFIFFDLVSQRAFKTGGSVVHWEALITLPLLLTAFTASACMAGLTCSIKCRKTLAAVFWSMVAVMAATGAASVCTFGALNASGEVAAVFMPFSPFYAIYLAVNPEQALSGTFAGTAPNMPLCRLLGIIASVAAGVFYLVIGSRLHKAMVRGFDMTIRRQTV